MLTGRITETSYKVQVDDLDVGGVVYHANYLKICERIRNDAFETLGVSFQRLFENDTVLAVVEAKLSYKRPVRIGTAFVYTQVIERSGKHLTFGHVICQDQFPLDTTADLVEIAATGVYAEVTLLAASLRQGRSKALPDVLLVPTNGAE